MEIKGCMIRLAPKKRQLRKQTTCQFCGSKLIVPTIDVLGHDTFLNIVRDVEKITGIPHHIILGESRIKEVSYARQLAMYRCVTETGASLTRVGRFFHRDHATIQHAVKKLKKCLTPAI